MNNLAEKEDVQKQEINDNVIELSVVQLHEQAISPCMRAIGRDWEWEL